MRFAPLFVLIWWAWTGHTVFSTRFDTDDVVQRGLTLVQMFAVAVMAANAKDALDSRSSAGFAAAYAARPVRARRAILPRASRTRRAGADDTVFDRARQRSAAVAGLGVVPAPDRFWIWGAAFAIDLGTPWLAVPHSVKVPPDAAHLPERFGLFTLILLGESVVAVMQGMESQEDWSPAAATAAIPRDGHLVRASGGGTSTARPAPRSSRCATRREAIRFHIWSYAHFPLYLGIIVAGVGVQRVVTAASRAALATTEAAILTGAIATVMIAMTRHRRDVSRQPQRWFGPTGPEPHAGGADARARNRLAPRVASRVDCTIAAGCVAQLVLSLSRRRRVDHSPEWRPPTTVERTQGVQCLGGGHRSLTKSPWPSVFRSTRMLKLRRDRLGSYRAETGTARRHLTFRSNQG